VPTLVFAWIYELTPDGLKRTSDVDRGESITHLTGRKLDYLVIGVLAAAVVLLLVDKFALGPRREAAQVKAALERAGAPAANAAGPTNAASAAPVQAGIPEIDKDPSIAVLPFVDMSQAKDQEYFSDGISEELLDLLAKVPKLRVIARTSSFAFKGEKTDLGDVARKLHVASILEGSVRKSGNTVRITVQLIRAMDNSHLWSETYDRAMDDIFKVQDEIAAAVVAQLKIKLLPDQQVTNPHRTVNTEAYNQYLLGNQFYNQGTPDGYRRAVAAYRQAIALDPSYGAAYAGLAIAECYSADYADSAAENAAGNQRARDAANKAIALAPDLADGYATRATLRSTGTWDWSGAQADLEKALELDPNNSIVQRRYGTLLQALGRLPEAIAATRKSIELDPLSAGSWSNLGSIYTASGQLHQAREALDHAVAIAPNAGLSNFHLGSLELLEGHSPEALATFRRAGEVFSQAGIAMAEHTLGNAKESQQALDQLIAKYAHDSAYQIAEVYGWRGEVDKTFEWLERAYAQHDNGIASIKADPRFVSVSSDPRFAALLKKLGLPP
jgi:TolB-like protein/Tfp pilus assembly protein PilF